MNQSFSDVCDSIYSVKPNFAGDEEAKRQLKLYIHQIFGEKISFPSIVIAGTKGKGSTSTVCESILRYCGWTTLLFTSPHIISVQERIKINGNNITEDEFISLYKDVMESLKDKNLKQPFFPNFFTLMFAFLVLKYQNQNNVVAIIEVGLGGKFDWTKIFRPTICGITRLDFDHTEILGKTPYSIAWNKFGIITKNSINFTIPQSQLFQEALNKLENEKSKKIYLVIPNWKKEMGLKGPTAEINTSLAVSISIEFMKQIKSNKNQFNESEKIDKNDSFDVVYNYDDVIKDEKLCKLIEEGVKNAHIDGRYQTIFCNGIKWLIDGAHTKESIEICSKWFLNECCKDKIDIKNDSILLCAISKNRNPNETLEILLNHDWKNVFYVTSFGKIELNQKKVEFFNNTQLAVQKVFDIRPKSVLVTGSLYLVGDVLKILNNL